MDLRQTVRFLCHRAILEKEVLTHLDQAVGDGDCGVNIERGATAILNRLDHADESAQARKLLLEVSGALNAAGCGTAGTLISFGIIAGAARCDSLSAFLEAALTRVKSAGRAQPGEKTLVDALVPAVDAARNGGTLEDVARAAREGAEKTREMTGTKGRALYSQSRAKGIQDPGAYLVAALLDEAVRCQRELHHEKDH
jgi:dihydroxyacetone kinase